MGGYSKIQNLGIQESKIGEQDRQIHRTLTTVNNF